MDIINKIGEDVAYRAEESQPVDEPTYEIGPTGSIRKTKRSPRPDGDTMSIRRHTYRGRAGFVLVGHPREHPGWGLCVFDEERQILERIRTAYREGDPDPTRFLLEPWRTKNPDVPIREWAKSGIASGADGGEA